MTFQKSNNKTQFKVGSIPFNRTTQEIEELVVLAFKEHGHIKWCKAVSNGLDFGIKWQGTLKNILIRHGIEQNPWSEENTVDYKTMRKHGSYVSFKTKYGLLKLDAEDACLIKEKSCRVYLCGNKNATQKPYAQVNGIPLHRIIHRSKSPLITDHINLDTLDNRVSNLRSATSKQNAANRAVSPKNKLGIKGITKRKNRYYVRLGRGGKITKCFVSLDDAKKYYKVKAKELYGEYWRG
jgi:hypothetical protein